MTSKHHSRPARGAGSQSEHPKQQLAALYTRVASAYVEQGPPRFAYVGRRLVEMVCVGVGDTVLDIGTGRGAVLFPAAERVGRSGRVVGIDVAPGMVEHTRAAISEKGLPQADVHLMDAENLLFPDESFTHVLCSFAVFFFPDLARVLAETWRVLRPGGVVGFAFQRGVDPRWAWYEELLRSEGALDNLPALPSNGTSGREGDLVARLVSAGFLETRERLEEVKLRYRDAQTWWASLWTHGSRLPLERLEREHVARLQAECLERAQTLAEPDGLPELHRFVFVTARRAA